MQDNFEEAYQQVYSAFIKLCGGYYEPKSQRDFEGSMLLGETLERLRMIKADQVFNLDYVALEYLYFAYKAILEEDGHCAD